MRKLGLLLIACFSSTLVSVVQNNIIRDLERNVLGQNRVPIHQDARIEALIDSKCIPTGSEDQKVIKSSGYRVQVYTGGNTRQAKNEAYSVTSDIKGRSPNLPIYTSFSPPRWLCRTSDLRGIKETDVVMYRLRTTGVFKEMLIVKNQISVPL